MRSLVVALLATTCLLTHSSVDAQPYPSKPIKVVVPFGPGTITDSLTRILTNELSKTMGQPVVVHNKSGADGSIGATEVARSAPDGYTLLVASNSTSAVVPLLRKVPPYDPIADFTPISFLGNTTFLIVVNPNVPAKSIAELIAYAKANPGKLNYGSANTTGIVSTALFATRNGLEMQHVPYKNETEAIPDLLSGQIQLMIASLSTTGSHVKAGNLRALSTALPARTPLLPDVPSITESGQPPFPIGGWGALIGPAKMPTEIVQRLNKEVVDALARPHIIEQMQKIGFAVQSSSPEEFAAYLKEQLATWKKALQDAKIEPE